MAAILNEMIHSQSTGNQTDVERNCFINNKNHEIIQQGDSLTAITKYI